jgi:PadR family transcriptional regulator, regulatory protein AphA
VKLTPFSYVVLTLVGDGGATAHELSEMRRRGRLYWSAPRSQWYAEPKRLAEAGLLAAAEEPGRTGPRTRYRLTAAGREALAGWVGSPAALPRIQNEVAVRILAADLVGEPAGLLTGLDSLRAEIAEVRGFLEEGAQSAAELPHRRDRLMIQHRMSHRLLDAFEAWADEVEELLTGSDPGDGVRPN